MRLAAILLTTCGCLGCSKMPEEKVPIQIETPEGSVEAHRSTADAAPQKITVVSADELDRFKAYAAQGPRFVASYLQNVDSPSLEDYDQAFRAWQLSDRKLFTAEEVTAILGGVLGEKCVADFDMEWVTVVDEYGEEYAVRSKSVEVMGFPFSTVLKRIETDQWDFMYGVYYAIKDQLESGETDAR